MKKVLWVSCIIFIAATIYIQMIAKPQPAHKDDGRFHYATYTDREAYGPLEKFAFAEEPVGEKIYGGIVSHHFFAAKEIAKLFFLMQKQNPETIVIIGPNHFNTGTHDILVSQYSYITPWGILETDKPRIEQLLKKNLANNDELPFEKEHSISVEVGFIKAIFPNVKIIPIILKRNTSAEKAEALAAELNRILPKNSLVLASVDFSHHLNRIAAKFHDETSISTIANFNYEKIYNLEIDSPPSVYTLLKYLQIRRAQKMTAKSVNSAELSDNAASEDVTSYLFSYFTSGAPDVKGNTSVLSFGDSMFDRQIKNKILEGGNPFEKIRGSESNFLRGVDFISLNLEGPITAEPNCLQKKYSFKFPPETAKLLFDNKINLINLANNHSNDCGSNGLKDTKKYLDYFRISYFGEIQENDDSNIKKIGNNFIAFMGINALNNSNNLEKYYQQIKKLKSEKYKVIINIHWGKEYEKNPTIQQKNIAHALIDNGADIIIGHHPHVVQPLEIYHDKTIFYSLGDFIFDQMPKETLLGLGLGTIIEEGQTKYYLFPYQTIKDIPVLMSYPEMQNFCQNYLKDVDVNKEDVCMFKK